MTDIHIREFAYAADYDAAIDLWKASGAGIRRNCHGGGAAARTAEPAAARPSGTTPKEVKPRFRGHRRAIQSLIGG